MFGPKAISPAFTGFSTTFVSQLISDNIRNKNITKTSNLYGINNIPATFVEIVLESGNIIGCYLILDHLLPADIDWPSRIVPLLILIMLLVLFGIIKI